MIMVKIYVWVGILFFMGVIIGSDELYDIRPYRGKSVDELKKIVQDNLIEPFDHPDQFKESEYYNPSIPTTDGGQYIKDCMATPEVDERWKVITTIQQVLIFNPLPVVYRWGAHNLEGFLKEEYDRLTIVDEDLSYKRTSYYPYPKDAFFYAWKRVAWIHPDNAFSLAYALEHGFEDKIITNVEWASYWNRRANLLEASVKWYKPKARIDECQYNGNFHAIQRFTKHVRSIRRVL